MIDVGPDPTAIRRCLSALRIRAVPIVVLTHFHADHVDGLAGVLGQLPVGEVWVSRTRPRRPRQPVSVPRAGLIGHGAVAPGG